MPPGPLQTMLNVVVEGITELVTECGPVTALTAPFQLALAGEADAVHEVALAGDQLSTDVSPALPEFGLAVSETVGAGAPGVVTIKEHDAPLFNAPLMPVIEKVYVLGGVPLVVSTTNKAVVP